MKKLFALLLALIMVLSLVACGGSADDSAAEDTEKIGEGRTLVVGIWGAEQETLVREHIIP